MSTFSSLAGDGGDMLGGFSSRSAGAEGPDQVSPIKDEEEEELAAAEAAQVAGAPAVGGGGDRNRYARDWSNLPQPAIHLILMGLGQAIGDAFSFAGVCKAWRSVFTDCKRELFSSPLVPVWLELPRLPANFYLEFMLRRIAGSIGSVLQIAQRTLNMTRLDSAAVCVQRDVSQPLPGRIWIGIIGGGGFWQPIRYPDPPHVCNNCYRLGHFIPNCRKGSSPSDFNKDSKGGAAGKGRKKHPANVNNRAWRPIAKNPGPAKQIPPPALVENGARKMLDALPQPETLPDLRGKGAAAGKGRKQRPANVNNRAWRPIAEKPGPAKQIPPPALVKNGARKVLDDLPQPETLPDLRGTIAQVQTHGVYLTPLKHSPQKSALGISAQTPSQENTDSNLLAPEQLSCQSSQQQAGALQVLDKLSQSADQLRSTAKGPVASAGSGPLQLSSQLPHHQIGAPQMLDEMIQSLDQLSLKAKAPAPSAARTGGLQTMLNPSASAWSPPLRGQGDVEKPDGFPPLQTSTAGKEPSRLATGLISLPITHDVMTFPGIPEPSEDIPLRVHVGTQLSHPVAQEHADPKLFAALPQSNLPHTSGTEKESTPLHADLPAATAPPPHQAAAADSSSPSPGVTEDHEAVK